MSVTRIREAFDQAGDALMEAKQEIDTETTPARLTRFLDMALDVIAVGLGTAVEMEEEDGDQEHTGDDSG